MSCKTALESPERGFFVTVGSGRLSHSMNRSPSSKAFAGIAAAKKLKAELLRDPNIVDTIRTLRLQNKMHDTIASALLSQELVERGTSKKVLISAISSTARELLGAELSDAITLETKHVVDAEDIGDAWKEGQAAATRARGQHVWEYADDRILCEVVGENTNGHGTPWKEIAWFLEHQHGIRSNAKGCRMRYYKIKPRPASGQESSMTLDEVDPRPQQSESESETDYGQVDIAHTMHSNGPRKAPTVAEIVHGERVDLRSRIVSLFRENKTAPMIVDVLEVELMGDGTRKRESLESLVRKVVVRVIPKNERKTHQKTAHENRAARGHSSQYEGRANAQRENGQKVWMPEEIEYFLELLKDEKFLRKTKLKDLPKDKLRMNHDFLAEAMNERFGTKEFTAHITLNRLERMRKREHDDANAKQKKRVMQRERI